jgi:hypothetical protein
MSAGCWPFGSLDEKTTSRSVFPETIQSNRVVLLVYSSIVSIQVLLYLSVPAAWLTQRDVDTTPPFVAGALHNLFFRRFESLFSSTMSRPPIVVN